MLLFFQLSQCLGTFLPLARQILVSPRLRIMLLPPNLLPRISQAVAHLLHLDGGIPLSQQVKYVCFSDFLLLQGHALIIVNFGPKYL